MKTSNSASRERSARYLMLIGMGFRMDDNIACYLNCARLALQLSPDNPEVIAYNLQALLRASRVDEAKLLVDRASEMAKTSSSVALAMSIYLRAVGQRPEADKFLEQAIKLDPNNPQAYVQKARFDPSTDASAKLYIHAAKLNADEPYVQELLLWQSERLAKTSKADLAHLRKAQVIHPDDPAWRSSLAFALLGKGQQKEAFDLMIAATQTPRLSLKALNQVAIYCAFNSQPQLAMKAANRAIELAPTLPESYFTKGHVYNSVADWENAEKNFLKALSLSPRYNVAYQALSNLPQYRSGAKSEKLYRRWLENCPTKGEPWTAAGGMASAKKDWPESYRCYAKACNLAIEARNHNIHSIAWCCAIAGAGTAQYKLGQTESAGQYARRFNLQKPPAAEGIMRIRPAFVDFTKLPASGPKLESANHALLADMLYESNELDDCVVEYQRAIALENNPEWHRGLLKAYIDKHDFAAAMKENLAVSNNIVTKDIPDIVDSWRKQTMH